MSFPMQALSSTTNTAIAGAKFHVVLNDLVNYTCCNIFPARSVDELYKSLWSTHGKNAAR